MLITRETDYALRILSRLESGQKLTSKEICDSELIPIQFAYKILKKMEKGGLIHVTRGKGGGCRLSCDLNQVTLYQLLLIMNEEVKVSACMGTGYECERREKRSFCPIHQKLIGIQQNFNQELQSYFLSDLIFSD